LKPCRAKATQERASLAPLISFSRVQAGADQPTWTLDACARARFEQGRDGRAVRRLLLSGPRSHRRRRSTRIDFRAAVFLRGGAGRRLLLSLLNQKRDRISERTAARRSLFLRTAFRDVRYCALCRFSDAGNADHVVRRPASEKRQGTKSRVVCSGGPCRGLSYGISVASVPRACQRALPPKLLAQGGQNWTPIWSAPVRVDR
jgi:hypothetical protein